jgi:hypothetical protein
VKLLIVFPPDSPETKAFAKEFVNSLLFLKDIIGQFLVHKSIGQNHGKFSMETFEKTLLEMPIEKFFADMVAQFLFDENFFDPKFWLKEFRKELLSDPKLFQDLEQGYAKFEAYKKTIMQ